MTVVVAAAVAVAGMQISQGCIYVVWMGSNGVLTSQVLCIPLMWRVGRASRLCVRLTTTPTSTRAHAMPDLAMHWHSETAPRSSWLAHRKKISEDLMMVSCHACMLMLILCPPSASAQLVITLGRSGALPWVLILGQ